MSGKKVVLKVEMVATGILSLMVAGLEVRELVVEREK